MKNDSKKSNSKSANKDINIDMGDLKNKLSGGVRKLVAYRVFIFFLAVAALYGFILWRINVLSNAPASESSAAAKVAAQPHIDPSIVQKIQNLQDNSVSVQSLFDAARQNPFQE